jgi:hypothetical protein
MEQEPKKARSNQRAFLRYLSGPYISAFSAISAFDSPPLQPQHSPDFIDLQPVMPITNKATATMLITFFMVYLSVWVEYKS